MNERIKELAKQATVSEPYYPAGNDGHPEYRIYVSQEKFAELIVWDCIELVQKYMSRWPEDHELTKQIKEHFGVE